MNSCNFCDNVYVHKRDLNKHLRNKHEIDHRKLNFLCAFENCVHKFAKVYQLHSHMKLDHGIDIVVEVLSFPTMKSEYKSTHALTFEYKSDFYFHI